MTHAPTPQFDSGYRCETGPARDRNEDSCLTISAQFGGHFNLQSFGLYLVADGMGGHDAGHVASNIATRAFAEFVLSQLYFPLLRRQTPPREADVLDLLERAVFVAHDAVLPSPGNGGTTLTAALVLGRRLYVAHVGDSRAYLYDGDELRLLTHDHSLVRRLQDTGQLTAEDALTHEYRNVLLQALGQAGALSADTFALDLPAEGRLLLCSDGLCGVVPREELAATLATPGRAQHLADRLYEAALVADSHDNIAAVVVGFRD